MKPEMSLKNNRKLFHRTEPKYPSNFCIQIKAET